MLARANVPNSDMLYFSGHGESKGPLIKELGCIFYVEDRPKHVVEVNEYSLVFLMDQVYNQGMEFENAIRVANTHEIVEQFKDG
jgi:hypothetical protein